MADALVFRDDLVETIPGDIDLPPQMGTYGPPIAPDTYLLKIPVNISQLAEVFDEKPKDKDGVEIEGGQPIQRIRFKFDRDHPLEIVGGPRNGDGITATISSSPRKRGKKGSDAPLVADLTYLLRESLGDRTSVVGTTRQWYAAMTSHAGHTFRVKTGLQGRCRDDKPRYIDAMNEGARLQAAGLPISPELQEKITSQGTVEDPTGTVGCGKRYYTKDFKDDKGETVFEIDCTCGAVLRGFPSIETYLPPLAG